MATRGTSSFIKSQVFPGGICPSVPALIESAEATGDLQLIDLEDITSSYPRTLAAWRANFLGNLGRLHPRFDERFRRFWVLYLSLCEAGFTERRISDVQLLFAKSLFPAERLPRWSGPAGRTPASAGAVEMRAREGALH